MNVGKIWYMCFNQEGAISNLNGGLLKLVNKFSYLGSSVSSTESDVNIGYRSYGSQIYRIK